MAARWEATEQHWSSDESPVPATSWLSGEHLHRPSLERVYAVSLQQYRGRSDVDVDEKDNWFWHIDVHRVAEQPVEEEKQLMMQENRDIQ